MDPLAPEWDVGISSNCPRSPRDTDEQKVPGMERGTWLMLCDVTVHNTMDRGVCKNQLDTASIQRSTYIHSFIHSFKLQQTDQKRIKYKKGHVMERKLPRPEWFLPLRTW